jgi:hypothetical protein
VGGGQREGRERDPRREREAEGGKEAPLRQHLFLFLFKLLYPASTVLTLSDAAVLGSWGGLGQASGLLETPTPTPVEKQGLLLLEFAVHSSREARKGAQEATT